MNNKTYLIVGGILLAGGAIGVIYYLSLKPKSEVRGPVTASRNANGTVTVRALVTNIGNKKGYFKIQAMVVKSPPCPSGQTGYKEENNWAAVLGCVQQDPGTNGSWAGGPQWVEVAPGQTVPLQATTSQALSPGQYGVYVNAAVSTEGTTETRLKDREHYYWTTVSVQ